MKNILIAAALVCSILSACSNSANNENTHEHEDGSKHEDHAEATAPTKQEEFNVDSGKIDSAVKAAPQPHDESKPHSH